MYIITVETTRTKTVSLLNCTDCNYGKMFTHKNFLIFFFFFVPLAFIAEDIFLRAALDYILCHEL